MLRPVGGGVVEWWWCVWGCLDTQASQLPTTSRSTSPRTRHSCFSLPLRAQCRHSGHRVCGAPGSTLHTGGVRYILTAKTTHPHEPKEGLNTPTSQRGTLRPPAVLPTAPRPAVQATGLRFRT